MPRNNGFDEEAVPLAKPADSPNKPPQSGFVQRFFIGVLFLICLCVWIMTSEEKRDTNLENRSEAGESHDKIDHGLCPNFCQARHDQIKEHHNGFDLISLNEMEEAVTKQQENLLEMLKTDYGDEMFDKVWKNKGHSALQSANETREYSTRHFKRRIQMKLLQVQIKILQERQNLEGCNCTSVQSGRRLQEQESPEQQIVLPEVPQFYDRFVWSSGGHSAAAGKLIH